MPQQIDTNYLEPSDVIIRRVGEGGSPCVTVNGGAQARTAQFRRLFPLSNPSEYISIQDSDRKEVGVLRTLDGLDQESRSIILEELDRRYFTPVVSRIKQLEQESGMWRFDVDTARGPATYFVRNWRDSAHEIGLNRWLVHSVDGQRFELPNTEKLDARSQDLLEQLL